MAKQAAALKIQSRGPGTMNSSPLREWRLWLAAAVLVLAVAAIYGQTYQHKFTSFDDDVYILNNPEVTGGLSWKGFVWAFGYHAANWHPLTWLSHMLDAQ